MLFGYNIHQETNMLSIITNFGCDEACPYCIWQQGHFLQQTKTHVITTDWIKLQQLIQKETRISVSGGGDPLFNLAINLPWWDKLFSIKPTHTQIDLHTAKIAPIDFLQTNSFNYYVFHAKNANQYFNIEDRLKKLPVNKIRIVIVADEGYTKADYLMLASAVRHAGFSFSIRRKVINKKAIETPLDDFLKSYKKWHYIEQTDYNQYFMPDNRIYTKFLEETSYVEI